MLNTDNINTTNNKSLESRRKKLNKIRDKKLYKLSKEDILYLISEAKIHIPCKQCIVYVLCKSKIKNHINLQRNILEKLLGFYPTIIDAKELDYRITSYVSEDMGLVFQKFKIECPELRKFDQEICVNISDFSIVHIRKLLLKCIFDIDY